MKKLFTIFCLILFCSVISFSQDSTRIPVVINFQFLSKTGSAVALSPLTLVEMSLQYHNKDSVKFYEENFSQTTDALGNAFFGIGTGTEAFPPILTDEMISNMAYAIYAADVFNDGGPTHIEGKIHFNPVPSAITAFSAENAKNAEHFGGNSYNPTPLTFDEIISLDPDFDSGLLTSSGGPFNTINPFILNQVLIRDSTLYKAGNTPGQMIRLKNGLANAFAISDSRILTTDGMVTLCAGNLQNRYYTVMNVTAKGGSSPHSIHNTSAIYANNEATEGSAGVNAKAGTWALYGAAPNGSLGVSSTGSNGAGTWGALAQAPDAGGFKYAVLGNSGGFTGAWAGAFFGSGFYTGTWAVSSDARLKTEIRSQSNALNKVMQMRPADYNYRQDTPWNLPQGLHHGFIAQEMQEVLPELVSDITMPNSLDTQDMHTSGTSQYKAINYIEIISILTQAMQELNTTLNTKIDHQAKEIETLKKEIKALNGKK